MIESPEQVVTEEPNRLEIADSLRRQALQLELEHRIELAVKRYGKELKSGTPYHEAFFIISECLEMGAHAIECSKNKQSFLRKLTRK